MKKCLIVSLMLLSLLTLAACGTTQGDTTDTTDTADSSQTAADITQDAQDNAQNDAQGDTQENAQNDTQEGSKNDGKIDSKTDSKIKPLPDALDLSSLTSGTVAASFDASSLKEVDGRLQLSFTVYNYEKFDAADISGLKAGDVLVVSGREMTVASVQSSDGYVTAVRRPAVCSSLSMRPATPTMSWAWTTARPTMRRVSSPSPWPIPAS